MKTCLVAGLLIACSSNTSNNVDADVSVGSAEGAVLYFNTVATSDEEIAVECEEPEPFRALRAEGARWTKMDEYGLSVDDGKTWTDFGTKTHIFTYEPPVLLGHVLVSMREPRINNIDEIHFSVDDGETWEQPAFDGKTDDLPFGTGVANLSDGTEIAHTPSGRIWLGGTGNWTAPKDSYPPFQLFGTRRSAGAVESGVWDSPPRLAVSTDSGASWTAQLNLPLTTQQVFPSDDGTLIALWGTSEPDRGIAFSMDEGKSWTAFANLIPLATVGPGPREAWIPQFVGFTEGKEIIRLLHTEDAGANWSNVTFTLNGAVLTDLIYRSTALLMNRGFRDTQGRQVFGLQWDGESRVCREIL